MEPQEGISRSALLVILLEIGLLLRVCPVVRLKRMKASLLSMIEACLTYVFARSATASATGGRCAHFAIGPLRVLLLDVRVKRWIAQVSFRAVAALEISPLDVVFRASLAFAPSLVLLAVVVAAVVSLTPAPVRLLLAIAPASGVIHHLELSLRVGIHWGAHHVGWNAGIHRPSRLAQHHILHVVVSHLAELLIGGVVA